MGGHPSTVQDREGHLKLGAKIAVRGTPGQPTYERCGAQLESTRDPIAYFREVPSGVLTDKREIASIWSQSTISTKVCGGRRSSRFKTIFSGVW